MNSKELIAFNKFLLKNNKLNYRKQNKLSTNIKNKKILFSLEVCQVQAIKHISQFGEYSNK